MYVVLAPLLNGNLNIVDLSLLLVVFVLPVPLVIFWEDLSIIKRILGIIITIVVVLFYVILIMFIGSKLKL